MAGQRRRLPHRGRGATGRRVRERAVTRPLGSEWSLGYPVWRSYQPLPPTSWRPGSSVSWAATTRARSRSCSTSCCSCCRRACSSAAVSSAWAGSPPGWPQSRAGAERRRRVRPLRHRVRRHHLARLGALHRSSSPSCCSRRSWACWAARSTAKGGARAPPSSSRPPRCRTSCSGTSPSSAPSCSLSWVPGPRGRAVSRGSRASWSPRHCCSRRSWSRWSSPVGRWITAPGSRRTSQLLGAPVILGELLSGRLLDAGRAPILSALVLVGLGVALSSWRDAVTRRLLAARRHVARPLLRTGHLGPPRAARRRARRPPHAPPSGAVGARHPPRGLVGTGGARPAPRRATPIHSHRDRWPRSWPPSFPSGRKGRSTSQQNARWGRENVAANEGEAADRQADPARGGEPSRGAPRAHGRRQGRDLGTQLPRGVDAFLRALVAASPRSGQLPLPLHVPHLRHHGAPQRGERRGRRHVRSPGGGGAARAGDARSPPAAGGERTIRRLRGLGRGLLRPRGRGRPLRVAAGHGLRRQHGLAHEPVAGARARGSAPARQPSPAQSRSLGTAPGGPVGPARAAVCRPRGGEAGPGLHRTAGIPASLLRFRQDHVGPGTAGDRRRATGAPSPRHPRTSPRCPSPQGRTSSRSGTRPGPCGGRCSWPESSSSSRSLAHFAGPRPRRSRTARRRGSPSSRGPSRHPASPRVSCCFSRERSPCARSSGVDWWRATTPRSTLRASSRWRQSWPTATCRRCGHPIWATVTGSPCSPSPRRCSTRERCRSSGWACGLRTRSRSHSPRSTSRGRSPSTAWDAGGRRSGASPSPAPSSGCSHPTSSSTSSFAPPTRRPPRLRSPPWPCSVSCAPSTTRAPRRIVLGGLLGALVVLAHDAAALLVFGAFAVILAARWAFEGRSGRTLLAGIATIDGRPRLLGLLLDPRAPGAAARQGGSAARGRPRLAPARRHPRAASLEPLGIWRVRARERRRDVLRGGAGPGAPGAGGLRSAPAAGARSHVGGRKGSRSVSWPWAVRGWPPPSRRRSGNRS